MKSEEKIKEAMENIKSQLVNSNHEQTIMLQGQYSSLEWILAEEKEKED